MTTTTENLVAALRRARSALHWYSENGEGNTPDKPDPDDVEAVSLADAALAQYDAEQAAPVEPVPAISGQDRATILAALRYYQQEGMGEPDNRTDDIHDIATNHDAEISLDDEGIDDLCERINAGATP